MSTVNEIRKVSATGVVTTLASLNWPKGVAVDASGNVYVTNSDAVCKVSQSGLVTTLAGSYIDGSMDGSGTEPGFMTRRD